MSDQRFKKYASIVVDYATRVKPGDQVGIVTTTSAWPIINDIFALVLDRGGHPHVLVDYSEFDEVFYAHANDAQLEFTPLLHQQIFSDFDVLIKIRCEANTRAMNQVPAALQAKRQKGLAPLVAVQMQRGATGSLRWLATQFPSQAYAIDADMGFEAYKDFFFRACHADDDTPDPVAHWQKIEKEQQRYLDMFQGHDKVEIHAANAELSLSVKGRTFLNACGKTNMPDGEIFTGPVENSVNGWVRFTYPAVLQNRVVEGAELTFENGKIVKARADKNEEFLLQMVNLDPGSCYLGEFAVGLNYEINKFTRSILLDEKIGGSFHMALGAGYPETGSVNKSLIHWDMICDLRNDSEIRVDGDVIYRNGFFTA